MGPRRTALPSGCSTPGLSCCHKHPLPVLLLLLLPLPSLQAHLRQQQLLLCQQPLVQPEMNPQQVQQ